MSDDRCAAPQGRAHILDTALKELRKRVEGEVRIALHTGKGGVGKTTISAATAIAAATGGADPAALHRSGPLDCRRAGRPVGADPIPVAGVRESVGRAGRHPRPLRAELVAHPWLPGRCAGRPRDGRGAGRRADGAARRGGDRGAAGVDRYGPARRRIVGSSTSSSSTARRPGRSLRLLALPETIGFYAQRLLGAPAAVMRDSRGGLSGLPGGAPIGSPTVR